jgi:hypothetical protein
MAFGASFARYVRLADMELAADPPGFGGDVP